MTSFDTIRAALARLVAHPSNDAKRLRAPALAELDRLEAEVEKYRDRAVCSGCGQDVTEAGNCETPGCDDGEMIPASDLPSALRSLRDEYNEWREDSNEELRESEAALRETRQALQDVIGACAPPVEALLAVHADAKYIAPTTLAGLREAATALRRAVLAGVETQPDPAGAGLAAEDRQ